MDDGKGMMTRKDYIRLMGAGFLAGAAAVSAGLACSGGGTEKKSCADCDIRKSYDKDPSSVLGRMWKWHIRYCPGWKGYLTSLPEKERQMIQEKYQ